MALLLLRPGAAGEVNPMPDENEMPVTGRYDPAMEPFDRMMTTFVRDHAVPGGALAVTRGGRLVYARGFGHADVEARRPVEPTSLFRIASVSKPLTAVAVLQLIEQGTLSLEDKVFEVLRFDAHIEEGATVDPRLARVTIRQLLHHTGGWDRDASFDPMFRSVQIARALGVEPPARPEHIIRYMMGRPLDSDPGERFAYSNFGYCLLGRVIEAVTGRSYEARVREAVLAPVGITDMRIGSTLASGRAAGEVRYYDVEGKREAAVIGERIGEPVERPYGAWYLEGFDAHGGWIGSAVDLVRFAAEFDEPSRCRLLRPKSIETMFARPAGPAGYLADGQPKPHFYGCGWSVRPVGEGANAWHMGRIPGTATVLVRRHDGLNWAVLFNAQVGPDGAFLGALIDPLVHEAADAVKAWPEAKEEPR